MKQQSSVVIEYHYRDGGVSVHHGDENQLWDGGAPANGLKHILIRPVTRDGEAQSRALLATERALAACEQLALAYKRGGGGSSINWEDVDSAYRLAREARMLARFGRLNGTPRRKLATSVHAEIAEALSALPDEALVQTFPGPRGTWFARIDLGARVRLSDAAFVRGGGTESEARHAGANAVRDAIRAGRHWLPSDILNRLLPYWRDKHGRVA